MLNPDKHNNVYGRSEGGKINRALRDLKVLTVVKWHSGQTSTITIEVAGSSPKVTAYKATRPLKAIAYSTVGSFMQTDTF